MLTAIIPIDSIEAARQLMRQAVGADLFEFRLDYLAQVDLAQIQFLQKQAQKPVLFTVRKVEQGGVYAHDEASRLAFIAQLMTLRPEYFDIEHDVPLDFCQKLKTLSPQTQLIRSYHHFSDTPDDLPALLKSMIDPVFSLYKIITTAQSILDTLRVLYFIKQYAQQYPLIAHAMGEVGVTSRILGKIFGNRLTYASVASAQIAPGLLSVKELTDIYHYATLDAQTQIYGLIGDPVAQSIGHQFHNAEFIKHHQNAVYVKFWVKNAELTAFFQAIQDLPVAGLSVTMPHKQAVLAFCNHATDEVQSIGAANTLIKHTNGYLAANTDGEAVVSLFPQDLKNKKVILLGAGGSANSIIYSLIKAGAQVGVYNRSQDKLDELRKKYPLKTFDLDEAIHADYDILINTIPAKFYQDNVNFIKGKIVMDINYQANPTLLLEDAQKNECICIDGYAMFYKQAQMQRDLWFKHYE